MVAMRKAVVLLGLLALAALSGGVAQAQTGLVTCTATAVPPVVRAEGIAELVGDIVLSCTNTSGQPAPAPNFLVNVSVSLNVFVTNNINFGQGANVTDAILVINENNCTTPSATGANFGACVGTNDGFQDPQYGTLAADNRLEWNQVNFPFPGADPDGDAGPAGPNPLTTTLRVTSVRGNASQLGVPDAATFPLTQITAFVSITGPTTIAITNNTLNVAVPILGLLVDVGDGITGLQCLDTTATSGVELEEGFATAFKTLGVPTFQPGNTQWESGYYAVGSNAGGGGASQGTRFIMRFFNIPEGLEIEVPQVIDNFALFTTADDDADDSGNIEGDELSRNDQCLVTQGLFPGPVQANDAGLATLEALKEQCTGDSLLLRLVTGTNANGGGGTPTSGTGTVEITLSGGFGVAVYEVFDNDPFRLESIDVPVVFDWEADTANDLPAVGSGQLSVSFAPLSTVIVASQTEPEPRFLDNAGDPDTIASIIRCTTTLLFPFVTNQAAFDTGVAISNTSRDWLGTDPQTGACTLHYHGTTTGGGAAMSEETSTPIAGGEQLIFTLSGGNPAQNIAGVPEFQGYIIAVCEFQFAHGFAFITDGFGGIPSIAQGYLALVIPTTDTGDRVPGVPNLHNLGESLSH